MIGVYVLITETKRKVCFGAMVHHSQFRWADWIPRVWICLKPIRIMGSQKVGWVYPKYSTWICFWWWWFVCGFHEQISQVCRRCNQYLDVFLLLVTLNQLVAMCFWYEWLILMVNDHDSHSCRYTDPMGKDSCHERWDEFIHNMTWICFLGDFLMDSTMGFILKPPLGRMCLELRRNLQAKPSDGHFCFISGFWKVLVCFFFVCWCHTWATVKDD